MAVFENDRIRDKAFKGVELNRGLSTPMLVGPEARTISPEEMKEDSYKETKANIAKIIKLLVEEEQITTTAIELSRKDPVNIGLDALIRLQKLKEQYNDATILIQGESEKMDQLMVEIKDKLVRVLEIRRKMYLDRELSQMRTKQFARDSERVQSLSDSQSARERPKRGLLRIWCWKWRMSGTTGSGGSYWK